MHLSELSRASLVKYSLGEAHTFLAFALDLYGWDWEAAETEYKLAIKLSPGYATAHLWYAWHLILMGRNSEGLIELRKAKMDQLCIDMERVQIDIGPDSALT